MLSLVISLFLSTVLTRIGAQIALHQLKVWLEKNKHKVKWEIIYTIFGPDPNNPLPPSPPVEPRRPILPWRRRALQQTDEQPEEQLPLSFAEKHCGFGFCLVATSVPVAIVNYAFLSVFGG